MHINVTWNCRVCVGVFFLFPVRMLAKPCHFGVNWPTKHCENKDGVYFFTLNFECYTRYNKLLLCNSENSHIAWWNKNNSKWGFSVIIKKRTKNLVSFFKNPFCSRQTQKTVVFLKNKQTGFSQPWWVVHLEVHLHRLWAASTRLFVLSMFSITLSHIPHFQRK